MSKPAEPFTGTSPSLGKSVNTRTVLAFGACNRNVIVLLVVLTSGERAAVTTLASTPAGPPRRGPPGPLPPGGLLLIWAWAETAMIAATTATGNERERFFIGWVLVGFAR